MRKETDLESKVPPDDVPFNRVDSPSIYDKRKRILLEINFGMVITGGLLFIIINYTRGLFLMSAAQAALCLLFSVLLILVRRNHNLVTPACWVYVICCLALSLFAFFEPRSHPTVFSWAIIMVFITMFLLGRRHGLIICLAYILLTVFILWWKHGTGGQQLALIALANFTVLYAVSFTFALFSENTRLNIETQLKEANHKLETLSNQDGLSGLYNRRYFDRFLAREWHRSRRDAAPVSLILADLDFFKNFNDAYGHLEGDECIKTVSRIIQASLSRPYDTAARYGGEEFVVILPNTDASGAKRLAQDIKQKLEDKALPHTASVAGNFVTLSFGVATVVPGKSGAPEDLIDLADKALYRSKEAGRNRIIEA